MTSDVQRVRAVELYAAGATAAEVGEIVGVSRSSVQRWLAEAGVARRRRGPRVTPEDAAAITRRRARVAELYGAGVLATSIADEVGVSLAQVYVDLDASGVARGRPGPRTLYPDHVGPRSCENCGRTFKAKPSRVARGFGRYCSRGCRSRHRARVTGRGVSSAFIESASALAGMDLGRRWKGRWASMKPPKPGKRSRGRPGLAVDGPIAEKVRALRADHPDWGRETLARAAGTTPAHVRKILSACA